MTLTPAEIRRYARHLVMPEVGREGQERLKEARVLLVGAGGLGSPAALYLAAAGVGRLGIVEFDRVDESNLQRQILYRSSDVGRPKLAAAVERLSEVNPHVEVAPVDGRLGADNARELVEAYDVVVDGSDNFPTRYLVNDACVLTDTPDVFGSVLRFEGQVSVFAAPGGPCYRCVYREPPPPEQAPSCAEAGVLGVLPGIIGALQAHEAIKLVLGLGEPLVGRFLVFDGVRMRFREIAVTKDPECPMCSDGAARRELVESGEACAGGETVNEGDLDGESELEEEIVPFDISPAELQRRLRDAARAAHRRRENPHGVLAGSNRGIDAPAAQRAGRAVRRARPGRRDRRDLSSRAPIVPGRRVPAAAGLRQGAQRRGRYRRLEPGDRLRRAAVLRWAAIGRARSFSSASWRPAAPSCG